MRMASNLSLEDDPDRQMAMPFAAADAYARQVMQWAREADFSAMHVWRDVSYGTDRLHQMDVFAPQQPRHAQGSPVLIFWHGGGWTNGYRQYVHFMANTVCSMGIVLVAPSYRLAPAHRLPAAYHDALACVNYVFENAPAWGGNPRHVLVSGHSAGGHVAALTALRRESSEPAHIKACLPISAIADLHHPAPASGSLEERVYTMVLEDASQDGVMSPICWTAGYTTPTILTVGEHDSERVRLSNRRLQALLQVQGLDAPLHMLTGQNHFQTHTGLSDQHHPWYSALAKHGQVSTL